MEPLRQSVATGSIRPGRIAFAIPLKARGACIDWELAQANLRRTIHSIRSAAGGDSVLIAVACHEPPHLGEVASRVQVLSAPFPAPSADGVDGGRDKARKRRLAAAWLREQL